MSSLRSLILSDPDTAFKVYVITPTEYISEITEKLFRLGVFEPIQQESKERELREIKEYIGFIERAKLLYNEISSYIKQPITIEITEIPTDIREGIKRVYANLSSILSDIEVLNNEVLNMKRSIEILLLIKQLIEKILEKYPNADTSILHYRGSIYAVETFIASKQSVNLIRSKALLTIAEAEGDNYAAISALLPLKGYEELFRALPQDVRIFNVVEKYGITKLDAVLNRLNIEIESLSQHISNVTSRIENIIERNINEIAMLKLLLDIEYKKIEIWKNTLSSKYLTTLVGWIPKSKIDSAIKILQGLPVYTMYEVDPNPPVDFNNLKPFKPFEIITEMYGIPSPNEWDPTPFLTYSFILFFSLMFADVGYGIGLALAARYVLPKFVENPKALGFRRLQQVLYISSAGCIILGILSKSFLGSLLGTHLPIPRILDYSDLMSMMGLSITIGYIFVLISHVFAALKNFRLKDRGGFLSEVGIVLIMIAGAQYLRPYLYSYFRANIPVIPIFYEYSLWISLASIAIIIIGKIISLHGLGALLWLFDVLGIIGDVFSFIRIAGIGMGSAMLAEIFNGFITGAFTMPNIIVGMVAGILMSFILHLFNLAVSAIGPFVHSLRLCLFEISSKFLEGAGRRIQPVKIAIEPIVLGSVSVR
ncbi:MAG: V-type ATPase 116kDa subunit family protein [Ignisphaera sp.]